MQRQKSILSFLRKPATSAGSKPIVNDVPDEKEIKGTDTPPEKVPRQIFASSRPSLFSSIKHKFSRVDSSSNPQSDSGFQVDNSSSVLSSLVKFDGPKDLSNIHLVPKELNRGDESNNTHKTMSTEGDKGSSFFSTVEDAVTRPDTPGTRPLVPRFKRVHESSAEISLPDNRKRTKILRASNDLVKNQDEDCVTGSKFEWLHPSQIKDANGRKAGNPLYDKRTLYIPPDALRKMSASQKQYWDVKRQYMDTIIFFKVGKFYELYELDAEIGYKELDWKITLSGVGKCRQVGVSENGIDDAVHKLIACGYKIGGIEQLETSEQAKSRGATSVDQRKLVHVHTPATTIDGNIGPVHLVAIKEGTRLEKDSTDLGFALVNCAALKFWVGSITDDASCAAPGALLLQASPKKIIYENRGLSKEAQEALRKYNLTGSTQSQMTCRRLWSSHGN